MTHILIIGAGLTGAALAFRLTRAGARVTVVEATRPAAAASGASFGWINASFFHSPAHFNLRAEGIAAHHRLDRDLGRTGTQWQGCLWWEEDLDAQAATLTALGYRVEVLTAARIKAREPALAAPEACLFFPDEGATDAGLLTQALLAASGAELWTGLPATGLLTRQGRVTGIETPAGKVLADHVILAAGTGAPALLAPLGLTLPMLPRPGLILRTRPLAARLFHILASPGQELRQDPQGRLIAPLSAAHQGDQAESLPATPGDLARAALGRIAGLLPGQDLQLDEINLAHRPVPGDGLPALGQTSLPGLTLAVLHSGVTLAPLVAELLAAEILGGPPSPLLAEFRPGRFGV